MKAIKNPFVSVSEWKKSPLKVIELAGENKDAVYILNDNKEVGVVVDSGRCKEIVEELAAKENLQERLLYLEVELRIAKNTKLISDKQIRVPSQNTCLKLKTSGSS